MKAWIVLNVFVKKCLEILRLRGDPSQAPKSIENVTIAKYLTKINQYGYRTKMIDFG